MSGLVVVALLCGVFAMLVRRMFARTAANDHMADWLENFSVESYRPMERLLDESDYRFLEAQPGYHPGIARELRAERRKIFRGYLRQMTADFNKLMRIANMLVVCATEDRSEFASALGKLRRTFYWNVVCIEVRLAAGSVPMGSLSPGRLIDSLDLLREGILSLAPAEPAA